MHFSCVSAENFWEISGASSAIKDNYHTAHLLLHKVLSEILNFQMHCCQQSIQLFSAKGSKLCVFSVCDAAIRKEFHINSATKEKLDHF